MSFNTVWRSGIALALCALGTSAWALDNSVPAIHGDVSRSLLGDGTGVIIGIVDSGVDDLHPSLAGLDSLGNPRLVAEANFVTTEPASTGDDVHGHGTKVASAALSGDATFAGMATDARYVNARVLDSGAAFFSDSWVRNGIVYAINNGASVVNLSLAFNSSNNFGFSQLELIVDWAAYDQRISTAIASGNFTSGPSPVRGPASAFNGVTVGRTIADLSIVSAQSSGSFTGDGRMKPDVVAPGTLLTLANDDFEGPAPNWLGGNNGTSYASPHIAGLMAQMLEAGTTHGLSTDPLVLKASIMNTASKNVLDRDFNPWEQSGTVQLAGVTTVSQPLDTHAGTGLVDCLAVAEQYLSGEMAPGAVSSVGWDFHTLNSGQYIDYVIDPSLEGGSTLSATLTWYRHVARFDNGNGILDGGDNFFQEQPLSDLNLQVLRNGALVAESVSAVDNVEHLYLDVDQNAHYTLRVWGAGVFSGAEEFALAWHGTAVPEPGGLVLALVTAIWPIVRRRR